MFTFGPQYANVRPEKFVGRTRQKITIQRPHIARQMRHRLHCIHKTQRPNIVRHFHNPPHIGDRADRVGRPANRDKFGARRDFARQIGPIEGAIFGININLLHRHAAILGGHAPRRNIRIVIKRRHDNFITWLPLATQRTTQRKRQRSHICAQHNLVGIATEQRRQTRMTFRHNRIGALAGRKRAVNIGHRTTQIGRNLVNHLIRHLGSARIIEKHQRLALMGQTECRKMPAKRRKIERHRASKSKIRSQKSK